MATYRQHLPQLDGRLFLTDGGIETTLIFHEKLELPDLAAFDVLKTPQGEMALRKYFLACADIAARFETGLILESATWRASADWGRRLGYSPERLAAVNRRSIALLDVLRQERASDRTPMVISGCIGPRGDGYVVGSAMSVSQAQAYHQAQVEAFAGSAADMVCAMTMNYAEEAEGIVRAARAAQMPVAVLFTSKPTARCRRDNRCDRPSSALTKRRAGMRRVERIADACVPLFRGVA
jgi:homocysteine S-methyltransferase